MCRARLIASATHALVLRAGRALAARLHLAAVADVAAQQVDVLVVDGVDLVDAELAATTPRAPPVVAIAAVGPVATIRAVAARTAVEPSALAIEVGLVSRHAARPTAGAGPAYPLVRDCLERQVVCVDVTLGVRANRHAGRVAALRTGSAVPATEKLDLLGDELR